MTREEAKEIVAKKWGYKNWETCINDQPAYKVECIMDEVCDQQTSELRKELEELKRSIPLTDEEIERMAKEVLKEHQHNQNAFFYNGIVLGIRKAIQLTKQTGEGR